MTALAQLLERETELVSRFVALLTEEQAQLRSTNPSGLQVIHEEKNKLADQLNLLAASRAQIIGLSSDANTKEGMNAWLASQPAGSPLAAQWGKLIEFAREAKRLNELNAQLIRLHLEKTTMALSILNRQGSENTFYGSNGQAAQYTGSRIVDSA